MSDPVDTDELRTIGDGFKQRAWTQIGRDVIAAADEIDRLRAERIELVHVSLVESKRDELREVEADLSASVSMHEQARQLASSALRERDRLRAVIENAPHAYLECTARGLSCSCWKADALG